MSSGSSDGGSTMTKSEAGRLGAIKTVEKYRQIRLQKEKEYAKNPRYCIRCKGIIPFEMKWNFCSRSCHAKYFNQFRFPKRKCILCDQPIKTKKFCSKQCFTKYRRRSIQELIKTGKYKKTCSGNSVLKNFLIAERGLRCERCKMSEWMGKPMPICVHHKDGDASNNLPENMELICLNCHGQTPNFGRKNKRSTRTYRYRKMEPQSGVEPVSPDLPSQTASLALRQED